MDMLVIPKRLASDVSILAGNPDLMVDNRCRIVIFLLLTFERV